MRKKRIKRKGRREKILDKMDLGDRDKKSVHYGTKPGHFETSKIHFPTSEGVSEVSERANE